MTTAVCPACLYRPPRPNGIYCRSCIQADDQRPWDDDLRFGQRDQGVVRAHLEGLARRIEEGSVLQARADALLAQLEGEDFTVWQLVVDGLSEREIAAQLGTTRPRLYSSYLHRLRTAAGIPARPRRYQRKTA